MRYCTEIYGKQSVNCPYETTWHLSKFRRQLDNGMPNSLVLELKAKARNEDACQFAAHFYSRTTAKSNSDAQRIEQNCLDRP